MPRTITHETAAQAALRELNAEITLREQKLRENTDEIFRIQKALQRRYETARDLEVELEQFEATREEARRAVRADQAKWLADLKRRPKPIQITEFREETSKAAAA